MHLLKEVTRCGRKCFVWVANFHHVLPDLQSPWCILQPWLVPFYIVVVRIKAPWWKNNQICTHIKGTPGRWCNVKCHMACESWLGLVNTFYSPIIYRHHFSRYDTPNGQEEYCMCTGANGNTGEERNARIRISYTTYNQQNFEKEPPVWGSSKCCGSQHVLSLKWLPMKIWNMIRQW